MLSLVSNISLSWPSVPLARVSHLIFFAHLGPLRHQLSELAVVEDNGRLVGLDPDPGVPFQQSFQAVEAGPEPALRLG